MCCCKWESSLRILVISSLGRMYNPSNFSQSKQLDDLVQKKLSLYNVLVLLVLIGGGSIMGGEENSIMGGEEKSIMGGGESMMYGVHILIMYCTNNFKLLSHPPPHLPRPTPPSITPRFVQFSHLFSTDFTFI